MDVAQTPPMPEPLTVMHRIRPLIAVVIATLAVPTLVAAQPRGGGGGGGGGGRDPRPSPTPTLNARLDALDAEIASLSLARAGTPADRLALLELRLDLRVLRRWELEAAVAADAWSDAQVAHFLRAEQYARAAAFADAYTGPATPAVGAFHLGTFKTKPPGDVGASDRLARDAALALVSLMKLPGGFDARPARPAVTPRRAIPGATRPSDSEETPPAVDAESLARRARVLALSADLRRQLLQLSDRAVAARGDKDEAEPLRSLLETAVKVAEGLAGNLAVSPADRAKLETDLATAIALSIDPRLRERGRERLGTLEPYARLMARVGAMKLSPEQVRQFAPVIAFARTSADGPAALSAVEGYLRLTADFDARYGAGYAPKAFKPQAESSVRAFAAQRQAFLEVAANPTSGGALQRVVDSLQYHHDQLALLEKIPATQDVLAALRTRPTGALERRLNQAVVASSAAEPSADRAAARQFLDDTVALVEAAGALQSPLTSTAAPADVWEAFVGATPAALDAKRRAVVQEQANLLAGGTSADRAKLSRLVRLPELLGVLPVATQLSGDLGNIDASGKWVDLQVSRETLAALVEPLARESREAFAGFLTDDAEAFDRHPRARQRLAAFSAYIARLAEASRSLKVLEGDLLIAQQLLTAYDKSPFAAERLLSLASAVMAHDRTEGFPEPLLTDLMRRANR